MHLFRIFRARQPNCVSPMYVSRKMCRGLGLRQQARNRYKFGGFSVTRIKWNG